jgi:hypothetical protein
MNATAPTQLRIRLTPEAMRKYKDIPPLARLRVVSFVLQSHAEGIDLRELLAIRKVLINLGILLNQSLKTSWGKSTDGAAASDVVRVWKGLTK